MRRRRAREEAVEQQQEQRAQGEAVNNESSSSQAVVPNEEGGQGTVTQRRGGDNANKKAIKNAVQTSSSTVVRRWMLMGPFEWGFCANSMQPKPPRSHYDHVTKKLVLNLDVSVLCFASKCPRLQPKHILKLPPFPLLSYISALLPLGVQRRFVFQLPLLCQLSHLCLLRHVLRYCRYVGALFVAPRSGLFHTPHA